MTEEEARIYRQKKIKNKVGSLAVIAYTRLLRRFTPRNDNALDP